MKLSKRQLRKIIKEEKAKLLRETIADMANYQDMFEQMALKISDVFYDDMMKLYDEEPDAFARPAPGSEAMTRTERDVWEQQVVYATQELESAISFSIAQAIEEIEMKLHDGQYHDDR